MRQQANPHPADADLLLAADRELTHSRQTAVSTHLSACTECRQRLALMESVLREAGAIYRTGDDADASSLPTARARLQQSLGELQRTWERSWSTRLRRALPMPHPPLVAAAPLGVLALWLLVGTPTPTPGVIAAPDHADARPQSALTPGAVSTLTAQELCRGERPPRFVPARVRDTVVIAYRMQHVGADEYELDALVTPELGGTSDAANLWPQRYDSPVWNARVKDELERLLPEMVCRGDLDLASAQRDIATDWIAAYKHYFRTDAPLRAHVGPALEDDDDLQFESPRLIAQTTAASERSSAADLYLPAGSGQSRR